MNYNFQTAADLLSICGSEKLSLAEVMIRREMAMDERSREDIYCEMQINLDTMRNSIEKGLEGEVRSVTGLSGNDAKKLFDNRDKAHMGVHMAEIIASSMAVVEVNAAMGKIVAAPTAGASGILPAVLIVCGKERGWGDEKLIEGLFAAGAVGMLIASNATIAGAAGGCQAETGTGAAMAAASLVELSGGTPQASLHAAAIAIKNVIGLVCDPVAGLVECPCIKRNAIGAANAIVAADLALAGITSMIPFDECVMAMKSVGRTMHSDFKETARGGLAATPTAKRITRELGLTEADG